MGYFQQLYQKELADIAAGKKVDSSWASAARQEQEAERREQERQQEKLLDEQRRQTAIDEERLNAEYHRAEAQAAHFEKVEELVEEQAEAARQTRRLAEEHAEKENKANERRARADEERLAKQEEFHEKQLALTEEMNEADRLTKSLTYAAVLKLAELRELELRISDHEEMTRLLKRCITLYEDFIPKVKEIDEVLASDHRAFVQARSHATKLQSDRDNHLKELAALNQQKKCSEQLIAHINAELKPMGKGFWSWTSKNKTAHAEKLQKAQTLGSEANLLDEKINVLRAQIAHLEQMLSELEEAIKIMPRSTPLVRAGKIKLLAQELTEVVEKISNSYTNWAENSVHSEKYSSAYDLSNRLDIDIEFDICVILDRAKQDGSDDIEYPGLGPIPYGKDLATTVLTIKRLQKQGGVTSDYAYQAVQGYEQLRCLRSAITSGAFPHEPYELIDSPSSSGFEEFSDDSEMDPMFYEAIAVVKNASKASISLVQRHLKIGYNRAARIMEDMEKAGYVSALNGAGQRELLQPLLDEIL